LQANLIVQERKYEKANINLIQAEKILKEKDEDVKMVQAEYDTVMEERQVRYRCGNDALRVPRFVVLGDNRSSHGLPSENGYGDRHDRGIVRRTGKMDGPDSHVQIGNGPSRRRCIDINGIPLLLRAVQSRIPKSRSEAMVRLYTDSENPEFYHHKRHHLVDRHGYRKYMVAFVYETRKTEYGRNERSRFAP